MIEKQNVNIAIVGSRDIFNFNYVEEKFLKILIENNIIIDNVILISGGAKGVDTLAQKLQKIWFKY